MAEEKKQDKEEQPAERQPRWPWFAAGIVLIGFIAIVLFIIFWPSRYVWTDDAYLRVHYTTIAPRISGQLTAVLVTDNQRVRQGQPLALIDDRDYRAALAQAQAALAAAQAQEQNAAAELARQPALVAQAQAQYASAGAQLAFAKTNDVRYHGAAATGAETQQDRQQADMRLRQAAAAVVGDQAALLASEQQMPVLRAQLQAAHANVSSSAARVRQGQLNLSYTRILAPFDGMVGELSAQVGNYVGPGAALMALVPLNRLYVSANYRELTLRRMRPGDPVRVHVDAYDIVLKGVVNSIPPASGAAFAPIEPNNATGNFTKIVQRLPVKITFLPGQRGLGLLRLGMSVETTVDTGAQPNRAR